MIIKKETIADFLSVTAPNMKYGYENGAFVVCNYDKALEMRSQYKDCDECVILFFICDTEELYFMGYYESSLDEYIERYEIEDVEVDL